MYIAFYDEDDTLISAVRRKVVMNEAAEKQITIEKPLGEYDAFKVFIRSDGLNPVVSY